MLHGQYTEQCAPLTPAVYCSLCVGRWGCVRALSCYFCLAGDWRWHRDNAGPMYAFFAAMRGLQRSANQRPGMLTPDQWEARGCHWHRKCCVHSQYCHHTSISAQCQLSHLRPSQPGLWLVNTLCIWILNGWWYLTIPSANTRTKCRSDTPLC